MTPHRQLADLLYWYPYRWAVSYMGFGRELRVTRALSRMRASTMGDKLPQIAENVHRGLPNHKNPMRVALQSLISRFESRGAAVSFPRVTGESVDKYVRVSGLHHLRSVLASGHGAILAYPHTGPYNLALQALGVNGIPINRLGLPDLQLGAAGEVSGKLASLLAMPSVAAQRDLEGCLPGALFDGQGYLRPVLRALKKGKVVMVSYDGSPPGVPQVGRRVEVSLMGQRAGFPVGPAYLSLRSGVPLFPMALLPERHGGPFQLEISQPLSEPSGSDLKVNLQVMADRLAQHLSECVRKVPGSWQLWHDFEVGKLLL